MTPWYKCPCIYNPSVSFKAVDLFKNPWSLELRKLFKRSAQIPNHYYPRDWLKYEKNQINACIKILNEGFVKENMYYIHEENNSILMQVADNQEQGKSNRNIPKFLVLDRLGLPYFSSANRSSTVITNVTQSILYTSSLTLETDYSLSILSKLMSQWMASYIGTSNTTHWLTGFS